MFASKAGAKMVIGIDMSNILDQAEKIVRSNGFTEDRKSQRGLCMRADRVNSRQGSVSMEDELGGRSVGVVVVELKCGATKKVD